MNVEFTLLSIEMSCGIGLGLVLAQPLDQDNRTDSRGVAQGMKRHV